MEKAEVEQLIKKIIPDAHVTVENLRGTHNHLAVTVISQSFKGLTLIEQHQKIMDALKAPLESRKLHAVKIKTLKPKLD